MSVLLQLLTTVGVIAGLVWAFTAGTVALLDDSEKRSIRERVTSIWMGVQEAGPFALVKAPLQLFSAVVDAAYTRKLFSWRGFWRSCAVNSVVVIASLLLAGAFNGKLLGIETPPGKFSIKLFRPSKRLQRIPQCSKTKHRSSGRL